MNAEAENLLDFCKHVPAILRQQLLCNLVTDYVIKRRNHHDNSSDLEIRPSIQRFHGALLFVDIAGFTVLSQRLDVESLKNNINSYFTRMLGIIDKWGGDVVKFAGDALYVIWPMSAVPSSGGGKNTAYQEEARRAVEKAVSCGLEICAQCGRYEVFLGESNSGEKTSAIAATGIISKILPSWSLSSFISPKVAPVNSNDSNNPSTTAAGATPSSNLTYLDVHCGLSVGLMAGIDIGYGDRWEYFLAGEPIARVAEAEGAADKGDVVMCSISHRLLHANGDPILTASPSNAGAKSNAVINHGSASHTNTAGHGGGNAHSGGTTLANIPCKCGCLRVPSGVFKVSQVAPKGVRASRRVSQTRTKSEQEIISTELTAQDDKLGRAINTDLDMALVAATPLLQRHYMSTAEQYSHATSSGGARNQSFKKASSPAAAAAAAAAIVHNSNANISSNNGQSTKQNSARNSNRESPKVSEINNNTVNNSEIMLNELEEREQEFEELMHGSLRDHFLAWTRKAMLLGTMYHTHEVARNDYVPTFHVVTGHYFNLLGDVFHGNAESNGRPLHSQINRALSIDTNSNGQDSPVLTAANTNSLEDQKVDVSVRHKPIPALSPDTPTANGNGKDKYGAFKASTASELRSMTIMFINIIGLDIELTVDTEGAQNKEQQQNNNGNQSNQTSLKVTTKRPYSKSETKTEVKSPKKAPSTSSKQEQKDNDCAAAFGFLDRTDNELVADELLLKRLQGCIEVLGEAIYANGGQMRQFIVDDKGTVCIASFGLRGAVNVDNAAVAVEAAQRMITRLQDTLGLSASIGITSGKAYSGTVGSPLRHEYAIMGPCVNLSARLMGKCSANNMLCDTETVNRDRTHEFVKLSEVIAKGYSYPVGTFAPKKGGLQPVGGQGTPSPNGSVKSAMVSLKNASLKSSSNLLATAASTGFSVRSSSNNNGGNNSSNKANSAANNSNNEPAYERLWRLTESELFIPPTSDLTSTYSAQQQINSSINEVMVSNQLSVQLRLHGRKEEIATIFKALFTKRNRGDGMIFSLDEAARFIALCGAGGVGKSALVNSLAAKLQSMIRRDTAFNLLIFRNRGSSLHSILPFTSWLPILGELCTAVHRHHNQMNSHSNNSSGASSKHHVHPSPKSLANELAKKSAIIASATSPGVSTGNLARGWHAGSSFLSGLNLILQTLPSDAQAQKNLLLDAIGVTSIDSMDPLSKLDERRKLMICAELVAAIVSGAGRFLKKMLFIIMEDVQTIDIWSFSVLYQLWSRGRGVVAILNVSTSVDYSSHLITWAADTGIDELEEVDNDEGIDLIEQLFSRFDDERRFKVLELQPLSKEATLQMARETLGFSHIGNTHSQNPDASLSDTKKIDKNMNSVSIKSVRASQGDPALELNSIYEATGGNPLYTVELLKSFHHVRSHSSTNALQTKVSVATMNHRVEEIICFRLDKLEGAQQIVLKAAAVAAANGRSFDANIISFILLEHDYFHSETTNNNPSSPTGLDKRANPRSSFFSDDPSPKKQLHVSNLPLIQAALDELAEHGEFVQCTEETTNILNAMEDDNLTRSQKKKKMADSKYDEDEDDNDEDEEFIPRYEFKIPMEKATIYGLIIDEQKQYFHERAALYSGQLLSSLGPRIHRKIHQNHSTSKSHKNGVESRSEEAILRGEEGYHYQHAGHWGLALRSYRHSGELYKRSQQYSSYLFCLQQAARMVQFLEEETGPALSPFDDSYALKKYENRFMEIVKVGGDPLTFLDLDEELLRQIEPELEPIRELFEGDASLLPMTASLYVELALVQLISFEDPLHVSYALGTALKLFVACSYWSHLGQEEYDDIDGPGEATGLFLLTTTAILQLFYPLITVSNLQKEEKVLSVKGLEMGCEEVVNFNFDSATQQLQLLSIRILRALDQHKVEYAVSLLPEIKALRSNEGVVLDLITSFGCDLSLLSLIFIIRYISLSQEPSFVDLTAEYMHISLQGVLNSSHSRTVAWCVFLYIPLLVHLNRYEEAIQLLDRHRKLTRQARSEGNGVNNIGIVAMPPLLHEILRTWVYCMEDLAHRTSDLTTSTKVIHNINTNAILPLTESHVDEQADFISFEHVERLILILENRDKGMTIAEDTVDGITVQLESLLDAAGCGLSHILFDLTLFVASSSLDSSAYSELQTLCCRRIEGLPPLDSLLLSEGGRQTVVGRAFADQISFTALQRTLHASPSLPVALIKLKLTELLSSESMLTFIESGLKELRSAAQGYSSFSAGFLQMGSTYPEEFIRIAKAAGDR